MDNLNYSIFVKIAGPVISLILCLGCERKPAHLPTLSPEIAAYLAVGQSNAASDHLTNGMSDKQILSALGLNPATLVSNRTDGIDGFSVGYTNSVTEIMITRSTFSGVDVSRWLPKDQKKHWNLKK